jgi:hypothetical protein
VIRVRIEATSVWEIAQRRNPRGDWLNSEEISRPREPIRPAIPSQGCFETNQGIEMKKSMLTALALSLGLGALANAQVPPPPVTVDADSDGLLDINSLDDLNEMRNDLAGTSMRGSTVGCPGNVCRGYELTRNLDFDSNGDGISDWNQGNAWVPIGTSLCPFTAEFNGNGHAIRNIRIAYLDGVSSYGLFGFADGASFIAVRIEDPDVLVTSGNRQYSVGTLAGNLSNSYARFIYVTGADMQSSTQTHMGGVVGRADKSSIGQAQFSGELLVSSQPNDNKTASAAGIAGRASWTLLWNSSARGRIAGPRAAGLVETGTNLGISASFANVTLEALDSAGGLVNIAAYDKSDATLATNGGYYTINVSYAMGTITTNTNFGGGLLRYAVGFDGATARIADSFARMSIRNQQTNVYWSNLLQRANAGLVSIGNSYWVKDPAGTVLTERFGNVSVPGYSLVDMQCAATPVIANCANPSIFATWTAGWDFGTTAEMPALKTQPIHAWISADRPNATGDHETVAALMAKYPTQSCATPWYLSAKVKNSPYVFTSSTVLQSFEKLAKFSPREGLSCKNADQPDAACLDYQVSYLCDATATNGGVYWTPLTDVDDPTSGTGDDEPQAFGQACPAGNLVGIKNYVPGVVGRLGPPQKLNMFSATEGLRCLNSENACKDYELQFQCETVSDR